MDRRDRNVRFSNVISFRNNTSATDEYGNSDSESNSSCVTSSCNSVDDFFRDYKPPKKGTIIDDVDDQISNLQRNVRSRSSSPVERDQKGQYGSLYKEIMQFPYYMKEDFEKYKNIPKLNKNTEKKYIDMDNADIIFAIENINYTVILQAFVLDKFDKNYRDKYGNNYMHYVSLRGDARLLKTFLLFMDDAMILLTEENEDGVSALDMISRNSPLFQVVKEFSREIKFDTDMVTDDRFRLDMLEKIQNAKVKQINKDSKILLSLDGGGIRGLCTLQILKAVQGKMQNKLVKNVDWIAGTSTGSILGTFFAQNGTIKDAMKLYIKLKNSIFFSNYKGFRYDNVLYEEYLKTYMGTGKLSDITSKKIIIASARCYNRYKTRPVIFRNFKLDGRSDESYNANFYNNEEMGYEDPQIVETYKVIRASSAAPGYFSAFGDFIDGGLFLNNPSAVLLTEYFRYNHIQALNKKRDVTEATTDLACFISLGTGGEHNNKPSDHYKTLSTSTSAGLTDFISIGTFLQQASALPYSTSVTDGLPVAKAESWCFSLGIPFFRIQPKFNETPKLDLKYDHDIIDMMWEVEVFIKTHAYHEIKLLATYLDIVIEKRKNPLN